MSINTKENKEIIKKLIAFKEGYIENSKTPKEITSLLFDIDENMDLEQFNDKFNSIKDNIDKSVLSDNIFILAIGKLFDEPYINNTLNLTLEHNIKILEEGLENFHYQLKIESSKNFSKLEELFKSSLKINGIKYEEISNKNKMREFYSTTEGKKFLKEVNLYLENIGTVARSAGKIITQTIDNKQIKEAKEVKNKFGIPPKF